MYGAAAYLREVVGDPDAADRFIERIDESQAAQGRVGVSGPRLWIVMTLVRRGAFGEARRRLALEDPVRGSQNEDLDLEAWADLIAGEGTWDEAPRIVAEAREYSARAGALLLPAVADRLDGQAALATGEPKRAVDLLEQARATFTHLETPWERARTELHLARALLAAGQPNESAAAAQAALATFRELKAPNEIGEAEALLSGAAPSKR